MNIILGDKTYVAKPAKARMFRQAIEINEKIDFSNLTTEALDELIGFVCDIYGGQFTIDEVYDGLDADKLVSTLSKSISGIVNGVTEKLETKNAEAGEIPMPMFR